jgi:hypothetical protein
MKSFDFYEFAGILAPGTVVLARCLLFTPIDPRQQRCNLQRLRRWLRYLYLGSLRRGSRELFVQFLQLRPNQFAPTSSLLSSAKAFLQNWSSPAYLLTARVRGRRHRPDVDVALRINIEGFSPSTEGSEVRFIPNMRVPESSPIWRSQQYGESVTDHENLGNWSTSSGTRLPPRRALTSSIRLGSIVYGMVSLA